MLPILQTPSLLIMRDVRTWESHDGTHVKIYGPPLRKGLQINKNPLSHALPHQLGRRRGRRKRIVTLISFAIRATLAWYLRNNFVTVWVTETGRAVDGHKHYMKGAGFSELALQLNCLSFHSNCPYLSIYIGGSTLLNVHTSPCGVWRKVQ